MKKMNLLGQIFGKLQVVGTALPQTSAGGQRFTVWVCKCACGKSKAVKANKLRMGTTVSCGCKRALGGNSKHSYCRDGKVRPEYWAWHNAKRRCTEPKRHNYYRYGGRGITMCKQWEKSFAAFIGHIGPKPTNGAWSLDRIDNDRGYEPGNVRWATPKQQAANRRKWRRRVPA